MPYEITQPYGPDFEEGDRVRVSSGEDSGKEGVVQGYDRNNDLYFVEFEGEDLSVFFPGMLELLLEEDPPELEVETSHIQPGARVVVVYGHFLATAGVVLEANQEWSTSTGANVFNVELDDGRAITISETSLCLSPAQDELETTDPVNRPAHYTGHPSGIECIEITEHMSFTLGNAVKYIWRADLKNDAIEDLKKAAWYIEREISRRQAND